MKNSNEQQIDAPPIKSLPAGEVTKETEDSAFLANDFTSLAKLVGDKITVTGKVVAVAFQEERRDKILSVFCQPSSDQKEISKFVIAERSSDPFPDIKVLEEHLIGKDIKAEGDLELQLNDKQKVYKIYPRRKNDVLDLSTGKPIFSGVKK